VSPVPLPLDLAVARDHPVAVALMTAAELAGALEPVAVPPEVQVLAERLRLLLYALELRLEVALDA
jgi:hypothetical protein